MKNPWEEKPLADYENHMKPDSVMQLQAIIAGCNGLEQLVIMPSRFRLPNGKKPVQIGFES
ncbi:MAG: hypothetical protein PUA52_06770 [Lachnospiraceae bacterium]|nr:hypothetical protein [Lachnospiraceae bacterium]